MLDVFKCLRPLFLGFKLISFSRWLAPVLLVRLLIMITLHSTIRGAEEHKALRRFLIYTRGDEGRCLRQERN